MRNSEAALHSVARWVKRVVQDVDNTVRPARERPRAVMQFGEWWNAEVEFATRQLVGSTTATHNDSRPIRTDRAHLQSRGNGRRRSTQRALANEQLPVPASRDRVDLAEALPAATANFPQVAPNVGPQLFRTPRDRLQCTWPPPLVTLHRHAFRHLACSFRMLITTTCDTSHHCQHMPTPTATTFARFRASTGACSITRLLPALCAVDFPHRLIQCALSPMSIRRPRVRSAFERRKLLSLCAPRQPSG